MASLHTNPYCTPAAAAHTSSTNGAAISHLLAAYDEQLLQHCTAPSVDDDDAMPHFRMTSGHTTTAHTVAAAAAADAEQCVSVTTWRRDSAQQ